MKAALTGVFKKEPALLGGLITAIVAVGTNPDLRGAITGLAAVIASIAVRALVWSPSSVVEVVKETADATAEAVIKELDPETVGVVGDIPDVAVEAVKDTVDSVANTALKGAGFSRSERNAA